LAAAAARYFRDLDPTTLPEAKGLTRGARIFAWVSAMTALSIGLQYFSLSAWVRAIHGVLVVVNAAICIDLLRQRPARGELIFAADLPVFSALGGRANLLASVLDAAERQLGIDLRSTWALTVLRRSIEPAAVALLLLFWLSTSLTVVGVQERALVERFGVPEGGDPLEPGLYVHWPWPIDRVRTIEVGRVRTVEIGHEAGPEVGGSGGPENVLWAVQHAPSEFTLLLGNGRDLITVDAAVHYRIVDPYAWQYHSTNPEVALGSLAYRAVMRNTVDHTLSDALSENVALLTERMRKMVQVEADQLDLGVEIVGFTVRGMHPPVAVARSYQSVVSAQIRRGTRIVEAEAFRNSVIPAAQSDVLNRTSGARASGAEELGRAAGESQSFRAIEAQYRTSPTDYLFRRRLEAVEQHLAGRAFTILDARFLRDGGEIWVAP
jgi:regulator of protease activity HflC (stomatin/prohibitin superfamily)